MQRAKSLNIMGQMAALPASPEVARRESDAFCLQVLQGVSSPRLPADSAVKSSANNEKKRGAAGPPSTPLHRLSESSCSPSDDGQGQTPLRRATLRFSPESPGFFRPQSLMTGRWWNACGSRNIGGASPRACYCIAPLTSCLTPVRRGRA